MSWKYYTIRVSIVDAYNVRLEIRDVENNLIKEPGGGFGLNPDERFKIRELINKSRNRTISGDDLKYLGDLLFSALFDADLQRQFLEVSRRAQQENVFLRLELDIDEARFTEEASWPWELMYCRGENLWLAAVPHITLVRRRAMAHAAHNITLNPGERLRIALAVASPSDLHDVQFQALFDELRDIASTERIEILDVVERATLSKIDALLGQKPHIFHFIGHGKLKDENRRDSGQLALVDSKGKADWTAAEKFSVPFQRHTPGLVIIHSCESGTLSGSQALVGIASRLVQMNVPAVVAMQFKVTIPTAQMFALEFYRRLADSNPVDLAVQEARRCIALGPKGYDAPDFATPVLFMRAPDGQIFKRRTDIPDKEIVISRMAAEAQQMETNDSFHEAIKTWKDIRDLDPSYPDIGHSLDRLNKKVAIQTRTRKLRERLIERKSELGDPLFSQVKERLNKIEKEGGAHREQEYLQMMEDFLGDKLTVSQFKERLETKISLISREQVSNYQTLSERLHRGEMIPFLGHDALHLSGLPVYSANEITRQMAAKVGYDDFCGTLPMISQYCLTEREYSMGMIVDTVKELSGNEIVSGSVSALYELLGEIEKPLLVISSSYHQQLEKVFMKKKKKFAVVTHDIKAVAGDDTGKLYLKQYPGPAETETEKEKTYYGDDLSDLKLLENGYSLIYKICGCFGQLEELEGNTLLLLENDFFAFSRRLERLIPDYISGKFPKRGFLFMGYNLVEWQNRLIANAMLEKRAHGSESCYAVWQDPGPYDLAFWKSHHVTILEEDLKEFALRLKKNGKRLDKNGR